MLGRVRDEEAAIPLGLTVATAAAAGIYTLLGDIAPVTPWGAAVETCRNARTVGADLISASAGAGANVRSDPGQQFSQVGRLNANCAIGIGLDDYCVG